jgi:hypothetical protein
MASDDDDFRDFSGLANLRAAFDVWPAGQALPANVDDVARGAFALTLRDLLNGRGATVNLVRFADDGVSVWLLDALDRVTLEDFVRAVAGAFEPAAFAVAVVQPMKAPGDPTVRGVHCRAMFGDDLLDLSGEVAGADGPVDARGVPNWTVRKGRANDDRGRWIGVPPTIEIRLPMLGIAES